MRKKNIPRKRFHVSISSHEKEIRFHVIYFLKVLLDFRVIIFEKIDLNLVVDNINEMSFDLSFMNLMNLFDVEHTLHDEERILMYEKLFDVLKNEYLLSDVYEDVKRSFFKYHEELVSRKDYNSLFFMKKKFQMGNVPVKTLYHDEQNVHSFVKEARKAAFEILNKYPEEYYGRPFNHSMFYRIEGAFFEDISLERLFASIWSFITSSPHRSEMTDRLLEEMNDSKDMCTTGLVVRMMNSIRGFSEEFSFNLESFEYSKAFVFHILNKSLMKDPSFEDSDLNRIVMKEINSEDVRKELNARNINNNIITRILKDYTKSGWKFENNNFTPC